MKTQNRNLLIDKTTTRVEEYDVGASVGVTNCLLPESINVIMLF